MTMMKTLSVVLFAAILASASAFTLAGDRPEYTIGNTVNTFDPDKAEKTNTGYRYWFADKQLTDGKTLKLSVVKPGKGTHAPHEHAEDEFFFVLEGTAAELLDNPKVKEAYLGG